MGKVSTKADYLNFLWNPFNCHGSSDYELVSGLRFAIFRLWEYKYLLMKPFPPCRKLKLPWKLIKQIFPNLADRKLLFQWRGKSSVSAPTLHVTSSAHQDTVAVQAISRGKSTWGCCTLEGEVFRIGFHSYYGRVGAKELECQKW